MSLSLLALLLAESQDPKQPDFTEGRVSADPGAGPDVSVTALVEVESRNILWEKSRLESTRELTAKEIAELEEKVWAALHPSETNKGRPAPHLRRMDGRRNK